jgi:hypothetical protein
VRDGPLWVRHDGKYKRTQLDGSETIVAARASIDLEATVQLFKGIRIRCRGRFSYQDFATELASLPGKYAAPAGELLLARDHNGDPLGCVGLRQ